MKIGENIIVESGKRLIYPIRQAENIGLAPPENRKGDALRTLVRSLSGFQKEALVVS